MEIKTGAYTDSEIKSGYPQLDTDVTFSAAIGSCVGIKISEKEVYVPLKALKIILSAMESALEQGKK